MSRMIYDLVQLAGLLMLIAGVWANHGWASALELAGVLLILVPIVEAFLFGRRG